MTPKEISQKFTDIFGLDFHDFYDVDAWKNDREIKLDIWKFEAWFNARFPDGRENPLFQRIAYEYGDNTFDFIKEII